MNPTMAEMLSQARQADDRREMKRQQQRRSLAAEPRDEEAPRSRFGFRFPRLGIAESKG